MACEPLSVLILSTCLIAFWPCVLPLCFAVPILPYPMYFSKNDTQASESKENQDNSKISVDKKKKSEVPVPVKEEVRELKDVKEVKGVREVKEGVQTETPVPIGPSKGTLVPEKKQKRTKTRFDGSDEESSYESEEEYCTVINCKDKNVGGRDMRKLDLECDLCGRYRANIYYDSDDGETDTDEKDKIIVRPKKKRKMVNKQTKTNKIAMKGSGDRCNCANRNFGRTARREDQLSCLTSRNFVLSK